MTPEMALEAVTRLDATRELLWQQLTDAKADLARMQAHSAAVEEVIALLQTVSRQTQDQLRYQVEDIVQTAIDTVFPGRYQFRMVFEDRNNRTAASIYLEQDGLRMDPMDSNGGGVGDLVALGLRMACWTIGRTDNVLIMDEPYKNLSANFRPVMVEILRNLSRRLGLQIILVTHDPEIIAVADRTFTLALRKGRTIIKEQR